MDDPTPASQNKDLLIVKFLYGFYYSAFGLFSSFGNVYYHAIGLTGSQVGWISSMNPLLGLFAGPIWGGLSDLYGVSQLLMLIAVGGVTFAMLGLSAGHTFAWLLIFTAIYSFFNGTIIPLIDSTNFAALGAKRENYGRQRIWGSIAYIVVTFIGGMILDRVGLIWVFYGCAIFMAALFAFLLFLPSRRVRMSGSIWSDFGALTSRTDWRFFIASLFIVGISIAGMNNFLGIYIKSMGGPDTLVGWVNSLSALSEVPVMFFGAVLIRKIGEKKMLAIAFSTYAVRFLLYSLLPGPYWALPIAVIHGISFGFYWVAGVVYANRLAPENMKATSQALFVATTSLANVISSPFSGMVMDRFGPAALFRCLSVICLLGLLVLLIGFRVQQKRPPDPILSPG
jgi:PPP family 3-phenylpropionic acid transporter